MMSFLPAQRRWMRHITRFLSACGINRIRLSDQDTYRSELTLPDGIQVSFCFIFQESYRAWPVTPTGIPSTIEDSNENSDMRKYRNPLRPILRFRAPFRILSTSSRNNCGTLVFRYSAAWKKFPDLIPWVGCMLRFHSPHARVPSNSSPLYFTIYSPSCICEALLPGMNGSSGFSVSKLPALWCCQRSPE